MVLALVVTLGAACGEDTVEPQSGDAGAGDAQDTPNAVLDASLPQSEVVVSVADTGDANTDTDTDDADAYTLPPNSITTCNGFFECIQTCPPDVDSCVGACHDAMNEEAEFLVRRFIACVNSFSCGEPDCVLRNCGQEAEACFKDD
jgi:hypothetical protein